MVVELKTDNMNIQRVILNAVMILNSYQSFYRLLNWFAVCLLLKTIVNVVVIS